MFWFRKPKKTSFVIHLDGEFLMAIAQEFKDLIATVDQSADKVVAAIADLKAANANALTDQEVSDVKTALGAVKTKLDNATV